MTTAKQDRDFISAMVSDSLLEDSIEWIGSNMNPEDVFTEEQLRDWAENNEMWMSEAGDE